MGGSVLYVLLCSGFIAPLVSADRFLVTAPSVFHVGVQEKVLVQVGETLLNKPVTCYLEHEVKSVIMSEPKTVRIANVGDIGSLSLEVFPHEVRQLSFAGGQPPYLNLVCDVGEKKKQIVRVLVSLQNGYIFIQTDQPMYNPTQTVRFRIFALDHSMRPKSVLIFVHIINAEGNTIKKAQYKVTDGIFSTFFHIPDISQPGVWKIKAYYKGDEKSASIREFKVQKFVLPSFVVTIRPEIDYLLETAKSFKFSVGALYSYGQTVDGGYHCRIGIRSGSEQITFIKGLEKTGAIRKGNAEVDLEVSDIKQKLQRVSLKRLAEDGARFYIAVTVTDTKSGEMQETEVFLPIVTQRYVVDLSRTRSYYIPKMPLDVVAVVRTPNGLPAINVPVTINVANTVEKSKIANTDAMGIVTYPFNLAADPQSISVEVTVDGHKFTKTVLRATSPSNSFLQISVSSKAENLLSASFSPVDGNPKDNRLYYMVVSKGVLVQSGSRETGLLTKTDIPITAAMTPSFRLIGYYYHTNNEIVADSVWVDVPDICEERIEVTDKYPGDHSPGDSVTLNIDVDSNAKVALLAVDKAIYALNAQNKLTPKQVFSSMQSYDLGCSYGGGENTAAVFNDAGLSFISHSRTVRSQMRQGFSCKSGFRRQRRAIDLQKELKAKESEFQDAELQKCCQHGLMLIPMPLTCEDRTKRISRTESQACVDAFLKCCQFAVKLRQKKRQEDLRSGHGRSESAAEAEDFFDTEQQNIRMSFPASFEFKEITVKGKTPHKLNVPDSITTWEIQAVSLSRSHGFCVADPLDIRVFKKVFIALRLPYSVKRNEQLAIVAVIYNYDKTEKELAVHLKPADGLCSPGSRSSTYYVNITVASGSAETVVFSAVPLKQGDIPIIIHLYDRKEEMGVDAIQKTLRVMTEGVEIRKEESYMINLDGRSDKTIPIDAEFPNMTVPDSITNVFVKVEEEAFSEASAMPLLSPSRVEGLIKAPTGCAEQTMIRMSPTALSIRYLDSSNRWFELSPGIRHTALDFVQNAYDRILTFKKKDGSYGAWLHRSSSNWLTALVVKVLSIVAESELKANAEQEIVSQLEIRDSVKYLIKTQKEDGSFSDPNPVIHREMQGGIGGLEKEVSLTAFITIALNHSLLFLDKETDEVKESISRATSFLLSRVKELNRPYALAITAYCLSTCLQDRSLGLPAWRKLQSLAINEGECKVWRVDENIRLTGEKQGNRVPLAVALTVETTAYALLTALSYGYIEDATAAACFLSSQENYEGGFKSTQDTIVALEALSKYAIQKPDSPFTSINVQFTRLGRGQMENLMLEKKGEKVEAQLKRLLGGQVTAKFSGKGKAKIKVVKAYYDLDPFSNCENLSINVTVQGKIEYAQNVDYEYDYGEESERKEEEDFPRSAIEWFDVRSRRRRDTQQSSENTLVYEVCVSHSLAQNLSGMAIADITLLSGFEPHTEDLDKLKDLSDKYISHYEVSKGRVLLYFNEIADGRECVKFEAKQTVPIGLVQPAPATFYDYYEPDRRCSVFYAAPQRSKLVSVLCTNDVCQCAESGCYKEKDTFQNTKKNRFGHACYHPLIDYGLVVTVDSVTEASSFKLYTTTVNEVLKNSGPALEEGDVKVFAKRKHCKGQLYIGKTYLIMGKDASSTTSKVTQSQYLLDSNTWVEQKPEPGKCKASNKSLMCKGFRDFLKEYQINGCTQ